MRCEACGRGLFMNEAAVCGRCVRGYRARVSWLLALATVGRIHVASAVGLSLHRARVERLSKHAMVTAA